MKQFRRLKLEEVKVLAEEGIELDAVEYQRQVEVRDARRRQEREDRLAREAIMTLEAMEREEQEAAAKAAGTPDVEGKDSLTCWIVACIKTVLFLIVLNSSNRNSIQQIEE